jgi:photosystem II stability/assembly factor-like uncharacterized protein
MLQYFKSHRQSMSYSRTPKISSGLAIVVLLTMLLSACGGSEPASSASDPRTAPRVNGFGTQQNHTHSLAQLPDNVLLLASHYGLFRSTDEGKNWKMVAAGVGQTMDGMMTDSLVYSPLDPKRIYVLTQTTGVVPYTGDLGLYSSDDEGLSWKLAMSAKELGDMYFVKPGNDNSKEVYVYIRKLGKLGLKVSQDAGQHFTATSALPFGMLYSLLALPNKPGELLIAGDSGIARSSDAGLHWSTVPGIQNTVYEIVTSGPGGPIYATGDDGLFVSHDDGKSFTRVYSEKSLGSLTVSPTQPDVIYGRTGSTIMRSGDGGKTWKTLPTVKGGTIWNLVADLKNPAWLYLTLSYPTAVYRYDDQSGQWTSLTPKA